MTRKNSQSPVRAHGSPRGRSPSRRERSPVRHRSSNTKKSPTRNRSPKRVLSPVREKSYNRTKSSHHRKSPPSGSPSPVRQKLSNRTGSPERGPSPVREKPLHRTKPSDHRKSPPARPPSPVRQKLPNQSRSTKQEKLRPSPPISPLKEKSSSRARSPKHVKSRPSVSRSPDSPSLSPRSKRLKRVAAEWDSQKGKEREHEKNHGKKCDRDLGRDLTIEKTDRRSERDEVGNGGSKSRHRQLDSPTDRHSRGPRRSRSPDNRGRNERENSRDHDQRNGDSDSVAKMNAVEETLDAKEKQKPSFELSGKLAAETNRVRGVTLLFNEPPDARKPEIRWRFYVFKGGEALTEPLYVHRQSCYLFGRERRVADIPTDHPSCSKQHAVLQYRQVEEEKPDGTMAKRVRPYMMDLGSTNGTFINENQMEPQRYYELFEKDTIKFGNSSREYVLLHENST